MLALIVFIIKLIIGGVASYLLPSLTIKEISKEDHLSISFIGIISTSIFTICIGIGGNESYILCAGGMFLLSSISINLSSEIEGISKLLFFGVAIVGLFIGIGYILQGIILSFLVYYVIKNQSDLFLFLDNESNNKDDE